MNYDNVIFFDGSCILCNGFADWIIRQDKLKVFKLAPLQGSTSANLLADADRNLDTLVFLNQGKLLKRSQAVLRIFSLLPGPWKYFGYSGILPKIILDALYRFVARHRYRLLGKQHHCRIPTPADRERLLP